jgi:hypothetical protein
MITVINIIEYHRIILIHMDNNILIILCEQMNMFNGLIF